jgi:hypothetical protein
MQRLITLPFSRTPRFVESPVVTTLRTDKGARQAPATAARADRRPGHFLTVLLRALAAPAW